MLSGGNENGEKKTTVGLIARAAHFLCTFLCRCFERLQRESSRNVLVTRFMEEKSYVFLFTFFFNAAHSHLGVLPTKNVSYVYYFSL